MLDRRFSANPGLSGSDALTRTHRKPPYLAVGSEIEEGPMAKLRGTHTKRG